MTPNISNLDQTNGQSSLHAAIYQPQPAAQTMDATSPHDDLETLARQKGYGKVSIYGNNGSSRTPRKEGSALSQLLLQITNPGDPQSPIRAIFVSTEDRLFRDVEAISVASFIEVCQEYNVTVITPHFVYDFTRTIHIELFRSKCQEAYQYVTQMVISRLQAGRRAARQRRGE